MIRIAHRLNTIAADQRVAVIADGRIIEVGLAGVLRATHSAFPGCCIRIAPHEPQLARRPVCACRYARGLASPVRLDASRARVDVSRTGPRRAQHAVGNRACSRSGAIIITSMALVGAGGAAVNYYTPAALIRLFAILRTGGRYAERLVTHDSTLRLLARLRVWLFGRLVPLAPAGLGSLRSAELFSRLRADVDALEHAYLGVLLPLLVAAVIMLVALATTLIYLPVLSGPLLVLFGCGAVLLPGWTLRRGAVPGATAAACSEAMRSLASDGLRGRAELSLYGAEAAHAEQLAAVSARQYQAQRQVDRLQALGGAGVMLRAQLAAVVALLLGLSAVRGGALSGPGLAMLVLLIPAAFETIAPLPEAWAQLGATLASARRVFALADIPPPWWNRKRLRPTSAGMT